jgi:hypothetical protein
LLPPLLLLLLLLLPLPQLLLVVAVLPLWRRLLELGFVIAMVEGHAFTRKIRSWPCSACSDKGAPELEGVVTGLLGGKNAAEAEPNCCGGGGGGGCCCD